MNAALSVIVSLTTVFAGGAAALGGDLLSPHSLPADDCIVADLCTEGGHGNETSDPQNGTSEAENGTADPEPENGTADPEPEPAEPEENATHHHHYHNETEHHHHYHNDTAEPEDKPEDVHFCTTGLYLLGEDYTFTWEVHEGFESFHLDWHFQPLTFGILSEPDVHVELVDGAGNVVLSADGDDAFWFSLGTEDLRGYAPGEWSFTVVAEDVAGDQGLVGSIEY